MHTRVLFSLGLMAFWGSLGKTRWNQFHWACCNVWMSSASFSFLLYHSKKISSFFLKIKHILRIRDFHKNTNIRLSVIFLNLFLPNWLSTYNISTRATLWQPFLTIPSVVIKAQKNIFSSIPHHLGFCNNHV